MKVCQLCLVLVAMMGASQALAANDLPSQADLAAMGLSGIEVMTDSEALAVRGLGYNGASAYGHSFAFVSSQGSAAGSVNGYKAKGKHFAAGRNESEAELEIKVSGGHNGGGYGGNSKSKKPKGGHTGGGHCNVCSPKPFSISIEASAGGSSIAIRK
jgi:hypothetical protein